MASELSRCWNDLREILQNQLTALSEVSRTLPTGADLRTFRSARGKAAARLLREPATQWSSRRLFRRAFMAIEEYTRTLEDSLQSLPENVSMDGRELCEALIPGRVGGLNARLLRMRKKEQLRLRAFVEAEVAHLSRTRFEAEGQCLVELCLAILVLRDPWELLRTATDASIAGDPMSPVEQGEGLEATRRGLETRIRLGDGSVEGLRRWPAATSTSLVKGLLSRALWRRAARVPDLGDERAAILEHWARQAQASESAIRLELALDECEGEALKRVEEMLEGMSDERTRLNDELEEAIHSLRKRLQGSLKEEFPPPRGDIVPVVSRLAELESFLKSTWDTLPQSIQVPTRYTALPAGRARMKSIFPRETVLKAFAQSVQDAVAQLLGEIESEHRKIVHEIERAREVVLFGMETPPEAGDSDPELLHEALQNAVSLLEFHRREQRDWREAAETRMSPVLASFFQAERLILNRDRLGVMAYLARQGVTKAVNLTVRKAGEFFARAIIELWKGVEKLVVTLLAYIGWKQAPAQGKVEVVTRPFLPEEFTVDLAAKELPIIYRHLFRFEAVQDPRFLIGRDRELAAISEARTFWEAGRPVAVIVVGQRGSGKTSLLNCALKRILGDLEVFRGEFGTRVTTEPQLRAELARMLDSPDPTSLEKYLAEKRRVVILEELERSFLRKVGCYGAIRGLQRLIAASSSTTLWILATNQLAFRFLDAAMQLGHSFSHRINAGSASLEDLRQAIMLRHNLSGLRLQFRPPPAPAQWWERIRYTVLGQHDPETVFFDSLARESAGVFRSAFEIWLGQIEMVQAGALYMKPWATPDLREVTDDLDLDDLFTLVAVLQHGSLTPEEHSDVFQKGIATSRAQLDELAAREIIESDPNRTGFRVRPEATRVVKEALYRRNLM